MTPVLQERLMHLDKLNLDRGAHDSFEKGHCAMEVAAWLAGETFNDHPLCVSEIIGVYIRSRNDDMNDTDRQMLKPYLPKLVDTAGTKEQELKRSWMAFDWYCRVSTPAWLRAAGLNDEADAIVATAPIVDVPSALAAQDALNKAKEPAHAAGNDAWIVYLPDAERAAGGDAAWIAAWAARDAAGDAAWIAAGDAAWAWAVARTSENAARAAAWTVWTAAGRGAAEPDLRPTVEHLQQEALKLLDAMISVTD